jgi:hypothetical protein
MRNDNRASLSFTAIGWALLLSGLIYYLANHAALPVPLESLHLKSLGPVGRFQGSVILGSLPDLIYVTAFGLLTCAYLRRIVISAFVTGAV